MLEQTGLRAQLLGNQPMLSTFLMLPRVEVVELLAAAGFEALLLDLEHGPITVSDMPPLVAAARSSSVYLVARMGDADPSHIAQVLDTGVDGILVPHVSSAAEAQAIVSASRYPPQGDRSLNPYVRATRYGIGRQSGTAAANDRTAVIVMIESRDALTNVDEICLVPGLDGVFVGPMDLSAALGFDGQPEHPHVIDAIQHVFQRAHVNSMAAGIYAPSAEAAARWKDRGACLVTFSADIALASRAFSAAVAEVNALAGRVSDVVPVS